MRRLLVLPLLIAAIGLAIWWPRQESAPTPAPAPTILAAASLQEALEDAATAWENKGHIKPILSFAASSALARQVEAGASADLFISADEKWMDTLAQKGLIAASTREPMVGNALVLVASISSGVSITPAPGFPLANELGTGKLALADPSGVPAGRYAKQALTHLKVWDSVSSRVVAADNVRAALALVARGEAALGIVYATDAAAEPKVRVVATFPADSHTPVTYPMALLKNAPSNDADAFRTFLLSPEAWAIFQRHGFTKPSQ